MKEIIRKTFQFLDKLTFCHCIKTDYAVAVRYPYKIKHKIALANIQRRATKELLRARDIPYIERLKLLKLPTLAYRRLRGDMIKVYKSLHNIYDQESALNLSRNSKMSQKC